MLLKATFPSSYFKLVEATPPAKKKWVFFGTACYKFMSVKNTPLPQQRLIYSTPFRRAPTFSWLVVSLRAARNMSLGRWLLVACFSSVKNHNVSGPHLFPSVTTHAQKSLCLPWTVLHRAKKSLCNSSQFRTLFLPHRFIKVRPSNQTPVRIEFLTICRIPGFPKSEQNRKSCGKPRF